MERTKPQDEKLAKAIEQVKAFRESGTEWMARQAVGDAVLILLRDRELTRPALLLQLRDMAEGRVPEWTGHSSVAAKAVEFIEAPPARLPEPTTSR